MRASPSRQGSRPIGTSSPAGASVRWGKRAVWQQVPSWAAAVPWTVHDAILLEGGPNLCCCKLDHLFHLFLMLEMEEALARILATIPPPTGESIALGEASGRVLLEPVVAPLDLPPFDNSSMDGYAVRSCDLAAAHQESPIRLRLIGRVAAGASFAGEVEPGTCVRLFTGSPLPLGADAVVMQEDTSVDSEHAEDVRFRAAVETGENVRRHGEDVKRGARLIGAGEGLGAGKLGLLAAVGVSRVLVGRRPTVGLLATGSELKEAGESLKPGQIYESNRLALAELIRRAGGVPKPYPLVPDELPATRLALTRAFNECDAVITSGGVSVGEMDYVRRAFEEGGGALQFWKVAIRPGRPFVFGRLERKYLFGLPGNPVSSVVTFLLLVRPALLRWQGVADVCLPARSGVLAEAMYNPDARRHFLRVQVDGAGNVRSAGTQASHILSSLAAANGLVDVPPRTSLAPGTRVQVMSLEG
jgi:molybdopterin molybdotransferase